VRRILRTREAGLDQREAGLHEHHEETGDQGPDEVDGNGVGVHIPSGVRGVRHFVHDMHNFVCTLH